jgi:hypothetical protein
MKFQILTYQRLKGTTDVVDPFEAIAIGLPWPMQNDRFHGKTPEEAREKVRRAAQLHLDEMYTNLTITEEEIAPATVDRFGKPL